MKKLLFFAVMAVFSLSSIVAQEKVKEDIKKGAEVVEKEAVKIYNQAKTGGFKFGASIGFPMMTTRDVSSFAFAFDGTYLFEVMNNLEVGGMLGFTNYKGDGTYVRNGIGEEAETLSHKSANFLPIAISGRYYFSDRTMFAGLDLGYAIKISGDEEVGGGLYARPKFGYNFGEFAAIVSFQKVSGSVKYDSRSDVFAVRGFDAIMIGVEYGF